MTAREQRITDLHDTALRHFRSGNDAMFNRMQRRASKFEAMSDAEFEAFDAAEKSAAPELNAAALRMTAFVTTV